MENMTRKLNANNMSVYKNDSNKPIRVFENNENKRILNLSKKWFGGLTDVEKSKIFDLNTLSVINGTSLPQDFKDVLIRDKYLVTETNDEFDLFNKFRYNFELQLKSKNNLYEGYLQNTKDVSIDKFLVRHESRKFDLLITKNQNKFTISKIIKNKVVNIYNIIDPSVVGKILALNHLNTELILENGKTFELI